MDSILVKIQDTVVKYADVVSQISRVDVEVVDNRLYRVAGTGMFSDKVNKDMSAEGYVYQQVLKTGRRQIIYEPGKELICQNCPHCNDCQEEIEISMPVRMGMEIIGIIGLAGSSREQKERILQDEQLYLDFLEQIADFITAKAKEYRELDNKNRLLDTLDCTIGHIDQGILIIGEDRVITTSNEAAKKQLELEYPEGTYVEIEATGDRINDRNEYKMKIGDREFSVMGHLYDLPGKEGRYARLLLFENSKAIQKKYYEMTSTVHTLDCSNIIGDSEETQKMKQEIMQVAQSSSTVLITGESGTGKEMVATAIWNASSRRTGRFVAINCAAIPEALLESELFGYVKGAFTGADPHGRIGKFELANKGVIFLDEIGDMPLYLQAKLLRVLQERKITRIGSNQVIPIDVRILAATNRDLREMIREKKFREDLYYRLNVIPLEIAPLRERTEDIRPLSEYFAGHYARKFQKYFWKITEQVLECLKRYPWPGNVRELENVVEFMVNMMGTDGILDEKTLPREVMEQGSRKEPEQKKNVEANIKTGDEETGEKITPTSLTLKELEQREIQKAIARCGNTTQGKKEAARQLGIGLATLYRKLEEIQNSQSEN